MKRIKKCLPFSITSFGTSYVHFIICVWFYINNVQNVARRTPGGSNKSPVLGQEKKIENGKMCSAKCPLPEQYPKHLRKVRKQKLKDRARVHFGASPSFLLE